MNDRSVDRVLRQVPEPLRGELAGAMRAEIELAIAAERLRCATLCAERASLWRGTLAAQPGSPRPGIDEARARGNEAQYLADLLGSAPEGVRPAQP